MKNKLIPVFTMLGILAASSCTNLEPDLSKGTVSIAPSQSGGAPKAPSISSVYEILNGMAGNQGNWFAMNEHSTDEIMGPTRGTDWDDFGTWRRLHLHTWAPDHNQVTDTWNFLNGALFQTTLIAETSTDARTKAEGQFLRAYFRWITCDLYGQVQTRPATAAANAIPEVLTRSAAIDAVIAELESSIANLPTYDGTNRAVATIEAAYALLAKAYLNKAVYKNDPTKPAGPFTFAAADMNNVIKYCNLVAANPVLKLDSYYWDNFKWDNGKQSPAGFIVGQVYGPVDPKNPKSPAGIGNPLGKIYDRSGNPLVFTRRASIFFNGEASGIRVNKFPLDPSTINDGAWGSTNEFPFLRFADVRLMKAEAILRGGSDAETALSIVNDIRENRKASKLSSVKISDILAERGRELYLEGHRRTDMVRFGVFNNPVEERAVASDAYKCVYPIPTVSLSSNPNLKQNFGY